MKLSISIFALVIMLSGCLRKDVVEENSNELITTLRLKFTEQGSNTASTFQFRDVDGPGGETPQVDTIRLKANTNYSVEAEILDESKDPVVDIHDEVEEEGTVHRLYLIPSAGIDITITELDYDSEGHPLGLKSTWQTGSAAQGRVTVTLRHYENGGKETSDPVNSSKSNTDAEVVFLVISY